MANQIDIVLKAVDKASGEINKVTGAGNKLSAGFKSLTGISLGAAGALMAVGQGLQFAINEAIEAEQAETRLNTVLQSTNNVAGVTKDSLLDMAESLSKVTVYSEETIMDAESLMLTFTKIGKDTFPQAMEAALNMSAAFGQDLKSSVIQLGKALNDPSGMAAMKRVGVSFSQAQIDMAKAMFEAGDAAGYQKLILGELNTEVGGMAKAMGTTYAGQVQIFKNNLGELAETVGVQLMPGLNDFMKILVALSGSNGIDIAAIKLVFMEADLRNLNDAFKDGRIGLEEYKLLTKEVQDTITALTGEVFTTSTAMEDYFTASELAAMGIRNVKDASIEAAEAIDNTGKSMLSLTDSMQSEEERFTDTYDRLMEVRKDILADMAVASGDTYAELEQDLRDNEADLQANVDAHDLANKKIMLGYLEQILAADGLTAAEATALLQQGVNWGIYSQAVVDETMVVMEQMGIMAEGFDDLPEGKTFTYTLVGNIHDSFYNAMRLSEKGISGMGQGTSGTSAIPFASGADFIVPPGYPNDSYPIRVQSGEHVKVTPKNQVNQGGGYSGPSAREIGDAVANALLRKGALG